MPEGSGGESTVAGPYCQNCGAILARNHIGPCPDCEDSRRRWNESLHAAVGFQASLNWVAARTIRETYLLGIKHSLKGHAKMVSLPVEVQAAYDAGFEKGLGESPSTKGQ